MNPYSKRGADPEIQVLQIVSPSSNIRVGSNSLEPDAQGNSQHAANLSFSANRRRKRSPSASGSSNPNGLVGHTSGKLPAMLDLDKYKEVVKMAANDLHPQPSSSPPPPPSSSASKIYDSPWTKFSQGLSCCCFPFLLSACGMKGYYVQQAWREKVLESEVKRSAKLALPIANHQLLFYMKKSQSKTIDLGCAEARAKLILLWLHH